MKALIIGSGFLLAIILGFWPGGLSGAKPAWWRWTVGVSMVVLVLLAFGVPTGGTFADAARVGMGRGDTAIVPVRGVVADRSELRNGFFTLRDRLGKEERIQVTSNAVNTAELTEGRDVILSMNFDHDGRYFVAHKLVSTDPIITLPLIPGLEERARNIYFHVPTAWLSQVAWFIAFGFGVQYLRRRRPEDDLKATSAAAIGTIFCILAATTGAVWARFNWGVFWNWDPRQVSIFIVLVIYGAYFALRSAIEDEEQRARISSLYLVLLAAPVLYFMFVMPRMMKGLHPGAAGDVNTGPVLSPQEDALDPIKQVLFSVSSFSFLMLFFWMLNISIRTALVEYRARQRRIESEEWPERPQVAIEKGVVRL
jgi:heme exporter protein C